METTLDQATSDAPPVTPKPWGIPAIAAVLAIPWLSWLASLFQDIEQDFSLIETLQLLILTIVLKDLLFIGLVAAFALWRYRLGLAAVGLRGFEASLWWLPLTVVVASYVIVFVYAAVLAGFGVEPPEQGLDSFFDYPSLLPLTWFALVVMAPLSEELFFRGFVFPGLIRPFGVPVAMIASGLLFGMFHVSGLDTLVSLFLPISLIGVLFAWVYYRTGSLWLSIASHAIFNLVSFVAMASTSG